MSPAAPQARATDALSAAHKRQRTDREIAAALVISPRTTDSHVQNILNRLGMRRSAEVAAWVVHHSPGRDW